MKRSLPAWQVILTLVIVLSLAGGALMMVNAPQADKDAVIKLRSKPGGAVVAAGSYGVPKGAPVLHDVAASGARSREKPPGR